MIYKEGKCLPCPPSVEQQIADIRLQMQAMNFLGISYADGKGEWSSTRQYNAGDVVFKDPMSYFAIQGSLGFDPAQNANIGVYWQPIATKGEQGNRIFIAQSGEVSITGSWTTYLTIEDYGQARVGDIVVGKNGVAGRIRNKYPTNIASGINGVKVRGSDGATGAPGTNGTNGTDGKDGTSIESVTTISHSVVGDETVTQCRVNYSGDKAPTEFDIHAKNGSDGGGNRYGHALNICITSSTYNDFVYIYFENDLPDKITLNTLPGVFQKIGAKNDQIQPGFFVNISSAIKAGPEYLGIATKFIYNSEQDNYVIKGMIGSSAGFSEFSYDVNVFVVYDNVSLV